MKRARQNIILEIIAAKDIETQNQLMQALSELGVKSTQATLSRLIVLKTLPGLASAASSAMDGMELPSLVGTVAGDDTVFLAMRDVKSAEQFCEEIRKLF